jgi:DNA-binding NarL/FixJ family response regulator
VATSLVAAPLGHELELLAARARLDRALLTTRASPAGSEVEAETRAPFGLTQRELEVLALLAVGESNRGIGEKLFISPRTAGVHVSNILGRMGVGGRVEAAAVAHRLGLAGERR